LRFSLRELRTTAFFCAPEKTKNPENALIFRILRKCAHLASREEGIRTPGLVFIVQNLLQAIFFYPCKAM